jgi:hypothetical protein
LDRDRPSSDIVSELIQIIFRQLSEMDSEIRSEKGVSQSVTQEGGVWTLHDSAESHEAHRTEMRFHLVAMTVSQTGRRKRE